MVEPLRDFNGFSWNIISKDIENIEYNLMYQNLNLLLGNTFLDKWVNNHEPLVDYFELFKDKIQKKYGEQILKQILNSIVRLSIMIKINIDEKFQKEIMRKKQKVEQDYNEYENIEMFLIKISKCKKKREKEIKQIDKILTDKKLLKEEYEKRNEKLPLEKKIFSERVFKQTLQKERQELLNQITEFNQMMNPKAFIETKNILEQKMKYFDIDEDMDLKDEIKKEMISLQKEVINCLKIDIDNIDNKNSIIDLIYKYRYYSLLPVNNKENISEVKELKNNINTLSKKLIKKAIKWKAIIKIVEDDEVNFSITKKLLLSKIISLQDIYIKAILEEESLIIYVYDEQVEDTTIKIENVKKEDIKIKLNKKIKLFI